MALREGPSDDARARKRHHLTNRAARTGGHFAKGAWRRLSVMGEFPGEARFGSVVRRAQVAAGDGIRFTPLARAAMFDTGHTTLVCL